MIIVFDSLGLRHLPTFKTLREYLVEEAKSKRGMDLSKDDIYGLHAKVYIRIQASVFLINFRCPVKVIIAIVEYFYFTILRHFYKILIDIYPIFWYYQI